MADTTDPVVPAASATADGELSDAAFESNSWQEPTGESPQAKLDREMDEWLADGDDDGEEFETESEEAEGPRAVAKEAKAKDDVQALAKKVTKAPKSGPDEPQAATNYKVKLEGEEKEISAEKMAKFLGYTPDELAVLKPGFAERLYQKEWLANQRTQQGSLAMKQGSLVMKQFDQFVSGLKGPDKVGAIESILSHPGIGVDFKEVATDYLTRHFEEAALPAEQKQLRAAHRELERIKAEQARVQQQAQAEHEQQQRVQYAAQLKSEIVGALEEGGMPADTRFIRRVVDLMKRERDENPDSPYSSAKDLIGALDAELQADVELLFAKLGAAGVAKRFPAIHKQLAEHRVKTLIGGKTQVAADKFEDRPAKPGKRTNALGKAVKGEKFGDLPWMK